MNGPAQIAQNHICQPLCFVSVSYVLQFNHKEKDFYSNFSKELIADFKFRGTVPQKSV
jgi:hypothetical protein